MLDQTPNFVSLNTQASSPTYDTAITHIPGLYENEKIKRQMSLHQKNYNRKIFKIIYNLAKVSIPAMITQAFAFFMEIVNMYFVGHLNEPEKVAGVGLGNMYVNIIC